MLGSLQSDLNKLGVATVAKGVCGACKKPIAGQVSLKKPSPNGRVLSYTWEGFLKANG